ncbi:MAG: hypothetical protein ACD_46C00181G0017 [uncultured bacterium]|nr:MAG: hypothetical protein ACD_46C00181G0017 [uncultured bacterium]
MAFRNEQEAFWAGEFGKEYVDRNKNQILLSSNIELFSKIFRRTHDIKSVIEFGANVGLNLQALKLLLPYLELTAVEINEHAVNELKKNLWVEVHHQSIVEFKPKKKFDLTFVKGVLIHINPNDLQTVYDLLYQTSTKYIAIAEYYNPSPVTIEYRGHKNKLFKRDFCGEMLDKFKDLKLVDYGFCYHRDTCFPQDDITWFLLEKNNS